MEKPLISIIVPCFNQAQYLDEALQSVLDQTYTNWECIIINDGSTDNTEEIVEKWLQTDNRFKYLYEENKGRSSARNYGLDVINGTYIQFLDSDDFLDKRKLEISFLELNHNNKNCNKIAITNFRMFDDNLQKSTMPYCKLSEQLFNYNSVLYKWETVFSIPIHCGLFHSSFFQNFRFSEELNAKEDWFMWINFFKNEPTIYFIDKPLVYYRRHQYNTTNNSEYMVENHKKAIIYLKHVISENDYIDYLFFELQQKYNETIKLRTTIYNYQNSTTYKIAQKIKETYFSKSIFKLIKKLKN